MAYPVMPLGFLGSQGDNDTYRIERSLRFNSADSAYLNRTPASAGNRKTWTWSGWVKRSALGADNVLFSAYSDANNFALIRFSDTSILRANFIEGGVSVAEMSTSAVYRDVASWYMITFTLDTTQATATDRMKLYVNGAQVTTFASKTNPTQNIDLDFNRTFAHNIGRLGSGTQHFDGYLTEINFIDGQALTPSSFGETDAITGRWKAKSYGGTYGTNGFYLKFADNSGTTSTTLGKDSSGNGNNWTPNNFSVTAGAGNDSLVDSPTNYGTDTGVGGEVRGNYATLNPLKSNSAFTLSNGNLDFSATSSAINSLYVTSSVGISFGKWYWEVTPSNIGAGPNIFVGIRLSSASTTSGSSGVFDSGYGYGAGGNKLDGTGGTSYGASYANNDVVGIALDLDAGTLVFYKNGVSQGTAFSNLSGVFEPAIDLNVGGVSRTIAGSCNFGQRPFAYAAPTGFKALCTTNLPQPTIQKPSKYMDVVTYTGNGSTQTISSLGFSPDFVWIKARSSAFHHGLFDTTRGATKALYSSLTNAEATEADSLTAFNSDGFSLGADTAGFVNRNSVTHVAWVWDEAPIAGMDIVSFTGTGSTQNISHSLGVAPKMVIYKCRNTAVTSWVVGHSLVNGGSSPWNYYMVLNATDAQALSSAAWNNTAPTSTQFTVGGSFTPNTFTYIAYLFAEVEGFSKFGSYTGNGSADGPFVWCGFRPRFLFTKRTDSGITNWQLVDSARFPTNECGGPLYPNSSNSEAGSSNVDLLSNGFKARANNGDLNASGGTYIFAAFAESPFKYARAR